MKDLAIKVGEYTDKEGEVRGEYKKLGVILSGENGEYALLDPTVNLAGCLVKQRLMNPQKAGDSVMCGIFSRGDQKEKRESAADEDFKDDKIPF